MYKGNTKLVLKHLGFLKDDYGFCFSFQTFNDYHGFCGPIDTYSFYNNNGCFTLHNIVQKGEWTWFLSKNYSNDQYELMNKKIDPNLYIATNCWMYSTILKRLSVSIKKQITTSGKVFGIAIGKNKTGDGSLS